MVIPAVDSPQIISAHGQTPQVVRYVFIDSVMPGVLALVLVVGYYATLLVGRQPSPTIESAFIAVISFYYGARAQPAGSFLARRGPDPPAPPVPTV